MGILHKAKCGYMYYRVGQQYNFGIVNSLAGATPQIPADAINAT
jgi:hypothetical protein